MSHSIIKSEKGRHMVKSMRREAEEFTRLDKLRAYYFEGWELSEEDEQFRIILESINAKLCGGMSKTQAVKSVAKQFKISERVVYQYIQDSIELHGDVFRHSKEGYRHIMTENFMRLAKHAKKKKDLDTQRRCFEAVAKINGLYDLDEQGKQPKVRQIVRRTRNPKAITGEEQIVEEVISEEYD